MVGEERIGQITSAIWSPPLECNVGQSMIALDYWQAGQSERVLRQDGMTRSGEISDLLFA